jgi:hypothetical protein
MLWELAGLKEQVPAAEKGFSMLTAALKKKMSAQGKTQKQSKPNAETQRKKDKKAGNRKSKTRKSSAKKKRG